MDKLKKVVAEIEEKISEIKAEFERADSAGFVYNRAKAIRKSAQDIKVAAQGLRELATETLKLQDSTK